MTKMLDGDCAERLSRSAPVELAVSTENSVTS